MSTLKCNLDISLPILFICGASTAYACNLLLTRNTLAISRRMVDMGHFITTVLFLLVQVFWYLQISNPNFEKNQPNCQGVLVSQLLFNSLFHVLCYLMLIQKVAFIAPTKKVKLAFQSVAVCLMIASVSTTLGMTAKTLNLSSCTMVFARKISQPGEILQLLLNLFLGTFFVYYYIVDFGFHEDVCEPNMPVFSHKTQKVWVGVQVGTPLFLTWIVSLCFLHPDLEPFHPIQTMVQDGLLLFSTSYAYSCINNVVVTPQLSHSVNSNGPTVPIRKASKQSN